MEQEGIKLIVCFDDKATQKYPVTLENPSEETLREYNNKGFGIFETANSFFATQEQIKDLAVKKGKTSVTKRNKEFLTCLNEVFADLDISKDSDGTTVEQREKLKNDLREALDKYCPASVYIITKNGLQPRWWLSEANIDEDTQNKYVNITNGIIEWSKQNGAKGDPVKDVTRVLRKPGYYHHKSEPYLITEIEGNRKIYTLNELEQYFCVEQENNVLSMYKKIDTEPNQIDSIDIKTVVTDVWNEKGSVANFDKDNHLIIDGVATATFVGRKDPGNYIATTSSDYPAKGNAITYVAETLGIDNKEAYKWLCRKYNIQNNKGGDNELKTVTAKELSTTEFLPIEWMIGRLIPENQITVISGPPGVFKTMSEIEWSLSVSMGGKAYGHFDTMESPVLLVIADGDNKRNIKKRINFLSNDPNDNFHLLIDSSFKLTEKSIEKLVALINEHKIKFIIFDSFRAVMPSDKKENDAGDVREVINRLRPLTNIGVTVLITHHDRKKPVNLRGYTSTDPNDLGEMMSGSVDIRGAVDCHLAMGAGKDKEGQFYIIITQTKCREEELLPAFRVNVNTERNDEGKTEKMALVYIGEHKLENAEETLKKAKEAIYEFIQKSTDKYIWREVIIENKPGGFGQRKLDEALKVLEKDDKIINSSKGSELGKSGSESNRKYYYISDGTHEVTDQNIVNTFDF